MHYGKLNNKKKLILFFLKFKFFKIFLTDKKFLWLQSCKSHYFLKTLISIKQKVRKKNKHDEDKMIEEKIQNNIETQEDNIKNEET